MIRLLSAAYQRIRRAHLARHEQMNALQEEFYRNGAAELNRHPGGRINKRKIPRPPAKWVVAGIAILYSTMLVNYALAHWIMSYVYDHWFPEAVSSVGRQLLTVVVMLFIFGLMMTAIRMIFDPGRKQIYLFIAWIDAMRRISKGDFSVTLDADPRHLGQLGVLVRSFNEMATELGQMEQMRQEFISNVSHEFQSPLTSIGGFARALQNEELTPETRRHYLRIIESESARLSKLSDNLLKLTSLESNHHPFEARSYRLDRQIRRVILGCEPQWQAKRLELDVDLDELSIVADEDLLNQVWSNLVHNAIKFTPEGGTMCIRLSERDNRIEATVTDTGIGVSEADLPHLFERFFKADKARSRSAGGSGLGLSIVKKIVELHHGTVAARSRIGEGTTFCVALPAVYRAEAAEQPQHP